MRERFKKGEMIKILPFLYGLLMLAMAGLVVNYRYFGNRVGIVEKSSFENENFVPVTQNQWDPIPESYPSRSHRLTKRMTEIHGMNREVHEFLWNMNRNDKRVNVDEKMNATSKSILRDIFYQMGQHVLKSLSRFRKAPEEKSQIEDFTPEISPTTLSTVELTSQNPSAIEKSAATQIKNENNDQMHCIAWSEADQSSDEIDVLKKAKASIESKIEELENEITPMKSTDSSQGKLPFLTLIENPQQPAFDKEQEVKNSTSKNSHSKPIPTKVSTISKLLFH